MPQLQPCAGHAWLLPSRAHLSDVITAQDIRRADAAWKAASVDAEAKREERLRVIKQALDEGWTHALVAAELGVTRGRIGQL